LINPLYHKRILLSRILAYRKVKKKEVIYKLDENFYEKILNGRYIRIMEGGRVVIRVIYELNWRKDTHKGSYGLPYHPSYDPSPHYLTLHPTPSTSLSPTPTSHIHLLVKNAYCPWHISNRYSSNYSVCLSIYYADCVISCISDIDHICCLIYS